MLVAVSIALAAAALYFLLWGCALWARESRSHRDITGFNRISLTPRRNAPPMTANTVRELARLPGVKTAIPEIVTVVRLLDADGVSRWYTTASTTPDDPMLASSPVIRGSRQWRLGQPSVVLSEAILERMGYKAHDPLPTAIPVRVRRGMSDEIVVRCRLVAVRGALGEKGVRIDLPTLARLRAFQTSAAGEIAPPADPTRIESLADYVRSLEEVHAVHLMMASDQDVPALCRRLESQSRFHIDAPYYRRGKENALFQVAGILGGGLTSALLAIVGVLLGAFIAREIGDERRLIALLQVAGASRWMVIGFYLQRWLIVAAIGTGFGTTFGCLVAHTFAAKPLAVALDTSDIEHVPWPLVMLAMITFSLTIIGAAIARAMFRRKLEDDLQSGDGVA